MIEMYQDEFNGFFLNWMYIIYISSYIYHVMETFRDNINKIVFYHRIMISCCYITMNTEPRCLFFRARKKSVSELYSIIVNLVLLHEMMHVDLIICLMDVQEEKWQIFSAPQQARAILIAEKIYLLCVLPNQKQPSIKVMRWHSCSNLPS